MKYGRPVLLGIFILAAGCTRPSSDSPGADVGPDTGEAESLGDAGENLEGGQVTDVAPADQVADDDVSGPDGRVSSRPDENALSDQGVSSQTPRSPVLRSLGRAIVTGVGLSGNSGDTH